MEAGMRSSAGTSACIDDPVLPVGASVSHRHAVLRGGRVLHFVWLLLIVFLCLSDSNGTRLFRKSDSSLLQTQVDLSAPTCKAIAETGQTVADHIPAVVPIKTTGLLRPNVFALPLKTGKDPGIVRVNDVTSVSFSLYVSQPSPFPPNHAKVDVDYLVVESGRWEISGGGTQEPVRMIVGNVMVGAGAIVTVKFDKDISWTKRPVVLVQVQESKAPRWRRAKVVKQSLDQFQVSVEDNDPAVGSFDKKQNANESSKPTRVAWLAMAEGEGVWSNIGFKVFNQKYEDLGMKMMLEGSFPYVIASLNSDESEVKDLQRIDETHVRVKPVTLQSINVAWFSFNRLDNSLQACVLADKPANRWLGSDWTSQNLDPKRRTMVPSARGGCYSMAEVGQTILNHVPMEVTLRNKDFAKPVVFALPTSHDKIPAIVRVMEVTATSFKAYIAEPAPYDGPHGKEDVDYLVLELGTWTFSPTLAKRQSTAQEMQIVVGTVVAGPGETVDVDFDSDVNWISNPVLLVQVQEANAPRWRQARIVKQNRAGFTVTLDDFDAASGSADQKIASRGKAVIAWAAMDESSGTWEGVRYRFGRERVDQSSKVDKIGAEKLIVASTIGAQRQYEHLRREGDQALALQAEDTKPGQSRNFFVSFASFEKMATNLLACRRPKVVHTGEYHPSGRRPLTQFSDACLNIGETGQLTADHLPVEVPIRNPDFATPVVFGVSSHRGEDPILLRVIDIKKDSFRAYVSEPQGYDGAHAKENIDYLILQPGTWTVNNAPSKASHDTFNVIVGLTTATPAEVVKVEFDPDIKWRSDPVILVQVQGGNAPRWRQARIVDKNQKSFSVILDDFESALGSYDQALNGKGNKEEIAWAAFEPGYGTWDHVNYQFGTETFDSPSERMYLPNAEKHLVASLESFPLAPSSRKRPVEDNTLFCDDTFQGGGWQLVRRVESGDAWHQATDKLQGTNDYGKYVPDPSAPSSFSVKFSSMSYDEVLVATGDMKKWAVFRRKELTKTGSDIAIQCEASHTKSTPYTVKVYNRENTPEDPWLSATDHHAASDSEAHSMLYGEASYKGWNFYLIHHNGANVFVRRKGVKCGAIGLRSDDRAYEHIRVRDDNLILVENEKQQLGSGGKLRIDFISFSKESQTLGACTISARRASSNPTVGYAPSTRSYAISKRAGRSYSKGRISYAQSYDVDHRYQSGFESQRFSSPYQSGHESQRFSSLTGCGVHLFVGTAHCSHQPATVFLSQTDFVRPLVFAVPSFAGSDPAIIRVFDVQKDKFQMFMSEPSPYDGTHPSETVDYLVAEAGLWESPGAGGPERQKMLAGVEMIAPGETVIVEFQGKASWTTDPVILVQLQTVSTSRWRQARIVRQDLGGFSIVVDDLESAKGSYDRRSSDIYGRSDRETVAWFAVESGSGVWDQVQFRFGRQMVQTPEQSIVLKDAKSLAVMALGADLVPFQHLRKLTSVPLSVTVQSEKKEVANSRNFFINFVSFSTLGGIQVCPSTEVFGNRRERQPRQRLCHTMGYIDTATLTHLPKTISLLLPDSLSNWEVAGDVGSGAYFRSPVIFLTPSFAGAEPVVPRVFDIYGKSFKAYVSEPKPYDGPHTKENVDYLVLEEGSWTVEGQSNSEASVPLQLVVGTVVAGPGEPVTVDYDDNISWKTDPVIIVQIQGGNSPRWRQARVLQQDRSGFKFVVDDMDPAIGSFDKKFTTRSDSIRYLSDVELIGWAAFEAGEGVWGSTTYKIAKQRFLETSSKMLLDRSEKYFVASLNGDTQPYEHVRQVSDRVVTVQSESMRLGVARDFSVAYVSFGKVGTLLTACETPMKRESHACGGALDITRPTHATVSGAGTIGGAVGTKVVLAIVARASESKPNCGLRHKWSVLITGPQTTQATVSDCDDLTGKFEATYTVTAAGSYSLNVLYDSVSLASFTPQFSSAEPSHLENGGEKRSSIRVLAGDQTGRLKLFATDKFGNPSCGRHKMWSCSVAGPGVSSCLATQCQETDSSITLEYGAKEVGNYVLKVAYGGNELFSLPIIASAGDPDPRNSHLESKQFMEADSPASFALSWLSFDRQDHPTCFGESFWEVLVTGPEQVTSNINPCDDRFGRISATVSMTKAGNYSAAVMYRKVQAMTATFSVHAGKPALKFSSALGSGVGGGGVGEKLLVTANIRDDGDNPSCGDPNYWKVTMTGPGQAVMKFGQCDAFDGSFEVAYTSAVMGTYHVQASYQGLRILDLHPNLLPGPPCALMSAFAGGKGMKGGMVGESLTIEVVSKDEFGNPSCGEKTLWAVKLGDATSSATDREDHEAKVQVGECSSITGLFSIQYQTSVAGPHNVVLSYQDSAIAQTTIVVKEGSPDPHRTHLVLNEVSAEAGHVITGTVEVRDRSGNPTCGERAQWVVQLVSSDSLDAFSKAIADIGDCAKDAGLLSISARATHAGAFTLKVLYAGEFIGSLPVRVKPGDPTLQYTKSSGSGTLPATAGDKLNVVLDLRDQYNNPLDTRDSKRWSDPNKWNGRLLGPGIVEIEFPHQNPSSNKLSGYFTPKLAGEYTVSIKYLDVEVQRYNVQVAAGPLIPSACEVYGHIHGGQANKLLNLDVICHDRFGNLCPGLDESKWSFVQTSGPEKLIITPHLPTGDNRGMSNTTYSVFYSARVSGTYEAVVSYATKFRRELSFQIEGRVASDDDDVTSPLPDPPDRDGVINQAPNLPSQPSRVGFSGRMPENCGDREDVKDDHGVTRQKVPPLKWVLAPYLPSYVGLPTVTSDKVLPLGDREISAECQSKLVGRVGVGSSSRYRLVSGMIQIDFRVSLPKGTPNLVDGLTTNVPLEVWLYSSPTRYFRIYFEGGPTKASRTCKLASPLVDGEFATIAGSNAWEYEVDYVLLIENVMDSSPENQLAPAELTVVLFEKGNPAKLPTTQVSLPTSLERLGLFRIAIASVEAQLSTPTSNSFTFAAHMEGDVNVFEGH